MTISGALTFAVNNIAISLACGLLIRAGLVWYAIYKKGDVER